MKTRDEMVREFYLRKLKTNKNNLMCPRPQTGPKASFMGEMNKPKLRKKKKKK